jgi:PncC family amidohydrolase
MNISSIFSLFFNNIDTDMTVSVAESVTAGALSNVLCSEPGSSKYFKGGVVAYSIKSKKEILNIDIKYAEQNNFANPFTTAEMAKSVVKMFNSRIGISTTGYSLPFSRPENKELDQCALDIKNPYTYICLYDRINKTEIIKKIEYEYIENESPAIQKANVQAKTALKAKEMYIEYVESITKKE